MWSTKAGQKAEDSQDLSAGALDLSLTDATRDLFVHLAAIHFSGAVSQTASIELVSPTGANYTFLIDSSALSSNDEYVYHPNKPFLVPAGWTFHLKSTNSGTPSVTAYADIIYQER